VDRHIDALIETLCIPTWGKVPKSRHVSHEQDQDFKTNDRKTSGLEKA